MSVRLRGICPACGGDRLYVHWADEESAYIECDSPDCPSDTLVQEMLDKRDQHVHLVKFDEDGFVCQHPLIERLRPEGLFACDLGPQFRALSAPPAVGLFRIPPGGTLDDMEAVDEADVDFDMPVVPPSPEVTQQTLTQAIPLGTVTAIPADLPLPEGFIETQREMRLPVAEYPELSEALVAAGYEPIDEDGVPCSAIDLPPEAFDSETQRYVLRVR